MRTERLRAGDDVRALLPAPEDYAEPVREIVAAVREGGDAAVRDFTARFDRAGIAPEELAVPPREVEAALGTVAPEVIAAMRSSIANVKAVAQAQIREGVAVDLDQGQRVEIGEVPVRRAAAYVPGGRAPYPSTLIMCAVTARAAGVGELTVCAPPGPDGRAHPLILAACTLCGVTEVYRMGGAQAIAALAYGTESVRAVDVIAGPGSAWVQEAKRQVSGVVGIDGIRGPSELVVVASAGADPDLLVLDLLAQAEHGPDSLVVAISEDNGILDAIGEAAARLAPDRPSVTDAPLVLVEAPSTRAALAAAEEIAPEHLQLAGEEAESLAGSVTRAGCVFTGRDGATAFGD